MIVPELCRDTASIQLTSVDEHHDVGIKLLD